MRLTKETTLTCLAGLMLVFTGWAWGGVVLWAQWVVLALGALSLVVALAPERAGRFGIELPASAVQAGLWIGLLLSATLAWQDLSRMLDEREATLLLVPEATLSPLGFAQWGLRGTLVGTLAAASTIIIAGFLRPSDDRRRLIRFPLFWLGLLLFAWIVCQALNPWGLIVHRDLVWKLIPQPHVSWLPSGVDAPFDSGEEPGGMNGWRQLLILFGPWALLCALRAAPLRRRHYAWLAALALVNGLAIALVGNIARAEGWKDFLGFVVPGLKIPPFGPFGYKNHAGVWLCLALALSLSLMFHLAKRRGERVDRGGPHLLVAGLSVLLALGAASTMSLGSTAFAFALLLLVSPAAYLLDRQLRRHLSLVPALVMVALGAVVVYAGLLSVDAQSWRWRLERKQAVVERTGQDDRAPLRRVAWAMVAEAPAGRRFSGWGAGSFRWVSPGYMAKEKVFLDSKGILIRRASQAHNDWLQSIAEWGAAGWVACACALVFLASRARRAWTRPSAPALALLGGLLLFAVHAWYDFLLFQPQMVLLAIILGWLSVIEREEPDSLA